MLARDLQGPPRPRDLPASAGQQGPPGPQDLLASAGQGPPGPLDLLASAGMGITQLVPARDLQGDLPGPRTGQEPAGPRDLLVLASAGQGPAGPQDLLVVTGWGYGLWTIAGERSDSYIGFYAAMDGAMDGFVRWPLATSRHS